MDNFWKLNQTYKHLSNPGSWKCIGFSKTHVILQGTFILEVPSHKRHMFMYKEIIMRM